MPSLGEAPSGGARAFWLLCRFCKVTRRQGGTLSGRYLNNGYALDPSRQSYRLRRQASSYQTKNTPLFLLLKFDARQRYVEDVAGTPTFFNRVYLRLFSSQTFKSCTSASLTVWFIPGYP